MGAVLVGAVALLANSARQVMQTNADVKTTEQLVVHGMGLVDPVTKGLAPTFTDAQGRLLADSPSSPNQLLDPQVLVFAHLVSDTESAVLDWSKLESHVADVTGRKVEDLAFDNGPDQLARIKAGTIHIVALHAADAPFLVDNYGFQPAAVLGDEAEGASGNHLDIIVPPASPINSVSDLRSHDLVCTVPSSITGYRAAIAIFMGDQGLRPNIDYTISWSMGQKKSIVGIAQKEYSAAAISDDKLQTLLQTGDVAAKDYRIIYHSDVIPRSTIGWFYNLKPELAAKVREAILSFKPDAPADASAGKPLHFLPVDYKKDFSLVRNIDNRFDPRLDAKTKHPTTQPAIPAAASETGPQ